MPICHILVGPPGSGKSTYAQKLVQEAGAVYINQDTQGREGHKEKFVAALLEGKDIVVDRMNFNKRQREFYIDAMRLSHEGRNYSIHMHVFYVPRSECLHRMSQRIDHPTIKDSESAEKALTHFFLQWEKPQNHEYDRLIEIGHDPSKKEQCVIIDLDGTLCNIDHRIHHVRGSIKNWSAFFEGIKDDRLNEWCDTLGKSLFVYNTILFLSGRPEQYRQPTEEWLERHYIFYHNDLIMRPEHDKRQDWIVKEMLLDFEILTRFRVLMAIDDRKQVVDMWRRRGITCLQCAEGDF